MVTNLIKVVLQYLVSLPLHSGGGKSGIGSLSVAVLENKYDSCKQIIMLTH